MKSDVGRANLRRSAWSLMAVLLLSPIASARAQQPVDPRQGAVPVDGAQAPAPVPGTEVPGLRTKIKDKPWSMRFGVTENFDDNVQVENRGSDDLSSQFQAGLSRSFTYGRGRTIATADTTYTKFQRFDGLDQLAYSVGGGSSYLLTRRLSWQIGDSYQSQYAQDTPILLEQGLFFPKVLTRINTGSTSFAYELTARSHLDVSASVQTVRFDSPALVDTDTISTRFVFSRQVSRSQSIGVSWGQTFANNATGDVQGILGVWQARLGPRLGLDASIGVLPYKILDGYRFATGGTGGVTVTVSRAVSANAHYERAVEQTYGFSGTHLTHRLRGGMSFALGRRLSIDEGGGYGINTYPLDPSFRLETYSIDSSAHYRLKDNLSLSGYFSNWHTMYASTPAVSASRGGVSLNYGFAWR